MAETATPPGPSESMWSRRYGPLPLWAWLVIGAGFLVVLWYRNQSANQNQNASTSTADQSTADSQIPQFVNQTYVQASPPDISNTQTVSVNPPPTGAKPPAPAHYVFTGKFGSLNGHPVDINYLVQSKYIKPQGKGYVFTGKGGTPKGHAVDYTYMQGIGLIKRVG